MVQIFRRMSTIQASSQLHILKHNYQYNETGQRNDERNSKLQRKGHTETQKNKGVNGKIQVLLLLKLMLKWWISVGGQLGTSEEIKL